MDCYIYYKSNSEHAMEVRRCVEILRSELSGTLEHLPRLQRRPASNNGIITWMEIYQEVPENFEAVLYAAIERSGIQTWISGERRLEYFIAPDELIA
ncbi:DUF4936 family protein [Undibacterium sp. Ji22W]|uniref:DUF4936 family protein n=1 Tax=Undibacterium sp. Ji22W TaxID=3413038 RepID=UPI003BF3B282